MYLENWHRNGADRNSFQMIELTAVERAVLEKLVQGDCEASTTLIRQLKDTKVSSREFTGAGFFTKLIVDVHAPRLKGNPAGKIGDVDGEAEGVTHGLGFLLYIEDGAIEMLEGYTYDEPWPDEVRNLTLSYSDESRDLDAIIYS